jgi:hypothetical protein
VKERSGSALSDDGSGTPASRTSGSLSERLSTMDLQGEDPDEVDGRYPSPHSFSISQGWIRAL